MHFNEITIGDFVPSRILWLTRIDPVPECDGQRIYSGRLIDAVTKAGAAVDILCFESEDPAARNGESDKAAAWHVIAPEPRSRWASMFSSLPSVAYRCATPNMRNAFADAMTQGVWDAIVFDSLASAWALPFFEKMNVKRQHRPKIVYVAHNHEASTRAMMARHYRGHSPLMRYALKRDAEKTQALETRLVNAADLVTAITPEDAEKFRAGQPSKRIIELSPGYAGRSVPKRTISEDMPRVAVIVGSFDWFAKRLNLESFIKVADPIFADAGVRLRVIGDGPPGYIDKLRARTEAIDFLGRVPSIDPHIADARIALVPERVGGGFKLKILDYVFHRLPILAIEGSISGAPLYTPSSVLTFSSFEELANGVVAAIDNVHLLNQLQTNAYDNCAQSFNWYDRGEKLVASMAAA